MKKGFNIRIWEIAATAVLLAASLSFCTPERQAGTHETALDRAVTDTDAAPAQERGGGGVTMSAAEGAGGADKPVPSDDRPLDGRVVSANNRFGFKLLARILETERDRNVFISPLSTTMALHMVYNGAARETREAMTAALELAGLGLADINAANATLRARLADPDPKVQMSVANSLWAKKTWTFNPDFMARNAAFFGAELSVLDFSAPGAPAVINEWVKMSTKGRIDKIVDGPIDPQTILFLINAIYFKGDWAKPFERADTRDETFYLPKGGRKRVPLMSRSGKYRYLKGDNFQAVRIPYGSGRVSMYVFLPDESSSLDTFTEGLTALNWTQWTGRFIETDGSLALPRFKLEYERSLNEDLKSLGMAVAFDRERADFSGISTGDDAGCIGDVLHKAFIDVDEKGSEAAAVTKVEMLILSAPPPQKPFIMRVDRPFFVAIRDDGTGAVLFMGVVVEPK